MEKQNKMIAYKIFRSILGPIYKFWYNPIIIGKENIPKTGNFIIAGNHVHIMDQCNVIISTKRNIHYMAKKEYFDNKKVAWFFRSVGCIPVDRSKKDPSATSSAIKVLSSNEALGIFPEGTRNKLKDERIEKLYKDFKIEIPYKSFRKIMKKTTTSQVDYLNFLLEKNIITKTEYKENILNVDKFLRKLVKKKIITIDDYYENILLPLKFGVVSLANKTSSPIIPYVIIGDYKFRGNRLKVIIGKPLKPMNDLEKANDRLRKEMLSMIKKEQKIDL